MAINGNTVNLSDNDTEKATDLQQNYVGTLRDLPPDPDAHLSESERAQIDRRLVWRLDLVMIPWLSLLYLLAFLDRTNIGNAKIAGLSEDLHMNTQQYNDTLTIFFISYALFEPLTNILLKRLRPSIFIPIIMYVTQPEHFTFPVRACTNQRSGCCGAHAWLVWDSFTTGLV